MKINEVAKLTGVTVRTLHYYDEVGLLKPKEVTKAGYRLYDNDALQTLQEILFFRELDFSLNDIKEIITNPHYDKNLALAKHKVLLIQKRNRLNGLIDLVDNTLKGENDMSFKQFDLTEIEKIKKQYTAEVKERWGNTPAYAESEAKTSSYNAAQWQLLHDESTAILMEFSKCRDLAPSSNKAQALVEKWQNYITANFYNCTKEILSYLGQMYLSDQRFANNIDENGTGTAEFMANAIAVYCNKNDK